MGNRVVVLSGSESKKDEAFKLGASEFVVTKGDGELKVAHKIDRLIVTTNTQPDWNRLLPVLNVRAAIVPLSASFDNFTIPYSMSWIFTLNLR